MAALSAQPMLYMLSLRRQHQQHTWQWTMAAQSLEQSQLQACQHLPQLPLQLLAKATLTAMCLTLSLLSHQNHNSLRQQPSALST